MERRTAPPPWTRRAACVAVLVSLACASAPSAEKRAVQRTVLEGATVEQTRSAAREAVAAVLPDASISVDGATLVATGQRGYGKRIELTLQDLGGSTGVVAEASRLVRKCERSLEAPVVYRECRSGEYAYTSTQCRVTHRPRTIVDRQSRADCPRERRADGGLERRVLEAIRAELGGNDATAGLLPAVEPLPDWP